MRAISVIIAMACLAAVTASAQEAAQAPAAPAADFGAPRVENGVIFLPGVKLALKVPAGASVTEVSGSQFAFRRGSDPSWMVFRQGTGTCKDWETKWRDRKYGDMGLPATRKKQYPKRPAAFDSRWHAVLVSDGMATVKSCLTDPAGRWVEIEADMISNPQAMSQDLPAATADIASRLFSTPPPPPAAARPSLWKSVPQSYYRNSSDCKTYSNSPDPQVRQLGSLSCDLASTQERWIKGCEGGNGFDCSSAARVWEKDRQFAAAGAFHERACEYGDERSCKDALSAYDRACKAQDGDACNAAQALRDKTRK